MPTFVRALWGIRGTRDGIPSPGLSKVFRDIDETLRNYPKPTPCVDYAFGLDNHDQLKKRGIDARLVSPLPVVNWDGNDCARDMESGPRAGRLAYGISLWRHKMECMKLAAEEFGEIVWLDWDCHLLRELPADFWERLRDGQPFRAALRQYRNPQCNWRKVDSRKIPHGAFLYCRDAETIKRAIDCHKKMPLDTDEIAFAAFVEELMGGSWLGSDRFFEMGFSAFCYATCNLIRQPKTEDILFVEGSGHHERLSGYVAPEPITEVA